MDGAEKLVSELIEPLVEELEGEDLDLGAGEAVDDDPGMVLGREEGAKDEVDDFAVTYHLARIDELAGGRAFEEGGDHDGACGEASGLHKKMSLRALAGAGRPIEPDDFAGEMEVFETEIFRQSSKDGVKNEVGILDLVLGVSFDDRNGFAHGWAEWSEGIMGGK